MGSCTCIAEATKYDLTKSIYDRQKDWKKSV
jgi:hypothetical protein